MTPKVLKTANDRQSIAPKVDRSEFIFVKCFLEEQRDTEILRREWVPRCNSTNKKVRAFGDALASGYFVMKERRDVSLRRLIEHGQLMCAFEGTTLLEGGAA